MTAPVSKWTGRTESEIAALSAKNRAAQKKVANPNFGKVHAYAPGSGFDALFDGSEQYTPPAKPKKPSNPAQEGRGKHPKAKKVSTPTEHQEQCAVVAWFAVVASSYGLDSRLLIAIPNGSILAGDARMRSIQARRLKDEGLRVGAPDLFLAFGRISIGYYGLFLEMKRVGWKPPKTPKTLNSRAYEHWRRQLDMHDTLRKQGYRVSTCSGAESAIAAIKDYLL